MKLNKTIGRVATTLVATAMLASLAAPVYAESSGQFDKDETEPAVYINKAITKPGTSYLPDADFEFSIAAVGTAPAAGVALTTTQGSDAKIESYPGVKLKETTPAQAEISTTSTVNTVTLAEQVKITFNVSEFEEPGEYQYTVTEAAGTYETDYGWSAQSLTLTVIVARDESNDNALYIYGYELTGSNSSKTDTFTNLYLTTGTDDPTKDFNLTKVVDGNFATSTDEANHYTFSVEVTNATTKNYYAVVTHSNCSGYEATEIFTLSANSAQNIAIKEGDTFVIQGLTKNDAVEVEELEASAEGFVTTFKVDGVSEATDDQKDLKATATNFSDNHSIECTNTKAASNPTGIVMDIAPYALLVVIAAAGCFVFLRKRRED